MENDFVDIGWLLKDIEETSSNDETTVRYQLDSSSLGSIIKSMDTEYDRNALKAVLFATRSRKEIKELGINADRAVTFLRKTISIAEESENALAAAEDMLNIRMTRKRKHIDERIDEINTKVAKLGDLLPETRRKDLETEKEMLTEQAENIKKLQIREDKYSVKRFNQSRKRLATDLLEENRVKRRRKSTGAPRALDSEDEELIRKAIEDKSTAHGRRHDAVMYVNHRVKKKDFLTIANYSLYKRGKKLIRSATTVLNRGRPRNVSSRAAKLHLGKGLFCAKKPPKTEHEENECTHHQRKHIKNAKCSLFSKDNDGLVLSMDDKAYLRPGTDVGARNTKSGKIYDVSDQEMQRKLPQHDFSVPQVHITPSSFRFMTGHQEIIDGKLHLVNDTDQTIVTLRPKYYIGSSGSIWASETMFLRRELPQLFEVTKGPYRYSHVSLRRFCAHVHDCLFYFEDTTMYEDVKAITKNPDCKFREYEVLRLSWIKSELCAATLRWDEDKIDVSAQDVAYGNEVKDAVRLIMDDLDQNIHASQLTGEQLWQVYGDLQRNMNQVLDCIKELQLPPVKTDILKNTDAGPGVGSSNVEVRYRDVEMARILNSDRMNRIHRARDDSGQNEAERSNACIGDALVDGGSLQWKFYDALGGLTQEEIKSLSLDDIKKREELAMEKNAWTVAKNVAERISDEPGPAGDYMQSYVTPCKDRHFFFNTEHLRQFLSTPDSKRKTIPGNAYFTKLDTFMKEHVQVGELYLEYLKGDCENTKKTLCEFCTKFPPSVPGLERVPRPMPDQEALPELRYLAFDKTPTVTLSGSQREVDDYQPRAQVKKLFQDGTITLDDAESIGKFSKTYAVEETLIRKYIEHLEYLKLKQEKRSEERRKKKQEEVNKTYNDFDWVQMFHDGSISKHTVSVLNLFLDKHNLSHGKMKKADKVRKISAWLANSEYHKTQEIGNGGEDKESTDEDTDVDISDEEGDVILQELGESSDDEEISDSENEQILLPRKSRTGRTCTTYLTRHFYGDSD